MNKARIVNRRTAGVLAFAFIAFLIMSSSASAQEVKRISMDFQEAALKDILKVFSQQSGLNFVATSNIEGKRITLYLDGVTVDDALNSIMKANNLAYEQPTGSSVFMVRDALGPEINMITKAYTLKFARLSKLSGDAGPAQQSIDIKPIIENILSKRRDGKALGSVIIDSRTNSVIVTSVPEDFKSVEETIKSLDAITPQALIEAEIVEIQASALKNLGLEWGTTSEGTFVTFSGPTKQTHFPFIRNHNPLSRGLLSADSTNPLEEVNTLGTLSLEDFAVVIKALETEGLARYLAKPRIMVLNNETAEIKITANTTIGVKKTSVTDTGEIIEEAQREETGVSLKVTPTINKDDYITMTLLPEVSRAAQSSFFTSYVDPSKRSAKTTVMVKDGQTIAIGGLLKSDEEDDKRRTPGVSSIPFLGNLFKRDKDKKTDTEIIIFITSHVIKDVGEVSSDLVKIEEPKGEGASKKSTATEKDKQMAQQREAEIEKTVIKLKKKRELSQ